MVVETKTKVVPLADRVVVKLVSQEQKTASGLYLPDTAKEKPQEAEVIAVGPGRYEDGKRIPLDVQVGNKVVFAKYSGTEVKVGDEELLILREADILAILE